MAPDPVFWPGRAYPNVEVRKAPPEKPGIALAASSLLFVKFDEPKFVPFRFQLMVPRLIVCLPAVFEAKLDAR